MQCIILELGNQITGSRRTEGVVVVDFKQESFYYRKETFHLRIVHLKKEIGRNTVCDPLRSTGWKNDYYIKLPLSR